MRLAEMLGFLQVFESVPQSTCGRLHVDSGLHLFPVVYWPHPMMQAMTRPLALLKQLMNNFRQMIQMNNLVVQHSRFNSIQLPCASLPRPHLARPGHSPAPHQIRFPNCHLAECLQHVVRTHQANYSVLHVGTTVRASTNDASFIMAYSWLPFVSSSSSDIVRITSFVMSCWQRPRFGPGSMSSSITSITQLQTATDGCVNVVRG